ncbi:reverse transcriptase domain-containing protein [Tanacetum coccineum]
MVVVAWLSSWRERKDEGVTVRITAVVWVFVVRYSVKWSCAVTRGGGDDGSGGVKMKVVVAWSTRCGGDDGDSWPKNGRKKKEASENFWREWGLVSQRSLVKETEDSGGSVVSEKFTEEVANLWVPKDDQKKRRFSMKDMGDVDVILGIRIEHESNGITISQSYYIEKVLKKFNYFDCTSVSTPMDTSEKLMPNNGQAVSQLKYSNIGISAMVIENKVKTLSITTFLLLAKKVFRVTAFPEYYSSSSNHPIIVPSDSDIEDAFSSTNVPDYFPATPGNTSPDSSNDLTRIAEDVLVDVVGYVYPVDFVILDIKEDEKRPFILGTPYLTTAKAVIKFDKGTITMRSGKSKMSFHRIPESLCKIEKGIKNNIDPITPTMTVIFDEKKLEDDLTSTSIEHWGQCSTYV